MPSARRHLADFPLPTARAVAVAFRRAFIRHSYHGTPHSAAFEAATVAYRALHPEADAVSAATTATEIIGAVEAAHPGWLYHGAKPRPRDPRHMHDAWEKNQRP